MSALSETGDVLVRTVSTLWPEAEAEVARTRRRDPSAVAEYAVVPGLRAPRLLVPLAGAPTVSRAVRRYSAAATRAEIWSRTTLAAALRATGPATFADRVRVHGTDAGSLAAALAEVIGEPVTFSVGIGSARVNRKPVLQLFGLDGRPRGFAKVGDSPRARSDVVAEARALRLLAERAWYSFTPPALLGQIGWRGRIVLVMGDLHYDRAQRPEDRRGPPLTAMTELTEAYAGPPRELEELSWTRRQRRIADHLEDARARRRMIAALDATVEAAAGRLWPIGAWHGDWTPWNMARWRGRLQVWDWERFEVGVPQGLDRLHYLVNVATRREGASAGSVQRALLAAGDGGPESHLLGAAYLIAVAGRYLPLAEGPGGQHIADRARRFLDVLGRWTDT